MRLKTGDIVRLFNGRDGEWQAVLDVTGKKDVSAQPERPTRPQPPAPPATHLVFAPLKKAAMDWMVEKAVELGATHLHPVLTQRTEARTLNRDRVHQHIIEAAAQCERLDMPGLGDLTPLSVFLANWPPDIPLYACLERDPDGRLLAPATGPAAGPVAYLIGPEGGFTPEEGEIIRRLPAARPVSLGPRILRAETAALAVLSVRLLSKNH